MAEVTEAPKKTEVTQGQGSEVKVAHPAATLMPWTESTFALMRRFSEEMDRLFEDFGFGRHLQTAFGRGRELLRREVGLIPAEWSPRIDVLEREGQYIVRADLPGMTKDDIKVEVTDEMITIQGERKQEKEEKREGYYYGERLRQLLPCHPAPRGRRPCKGDRRVPQRGARGHHACAEEAREEIPPPGDPGEEVGRPVGSTSSACPGWVVTHPGRNPLSKGQEQGPVTRVGRSNRRSPLRRPFVTCWASTESTTRSW